MKNVVMIVDTTVASIVAIETAENALNFDVKDAATGMVIVDIGNTVKAIAVTAMVTTTHRVFFD